MNSKIIFKIIFSVVFVGLALLKVLSDWFNIRIDITIIGLVLLAFLPWLSDYLKTIEAFGLKAEFISNSQKEKIDREANIIIEYNNNVINENKNLEITKSFNLYDQKMMNTISNVEDPLEKMVLIRYEIEKNLRDICNKKLKNELYLKNIKSMSDELCKRGIIISEVRNLVYDLLPFLNKAVHADISIKEYDDVKWIIDRGMLIVSYLNMIQGKNK